MARELHHPPFHYKLRPYIPSILRTPPPTSTAYTAYSHTSPLPSHQAPPTHTPTSETPTALPSPLLNSKVEPLYQLPNNLRLPPHRRFTFFALAHRCSRHGRHNSFASGKPISREKNVNTEVSMRSKRMKKRMERASGRGDCVDEGAGSVSGGWEGGSMMALFLAWEASLRLHLRREDRGWWLFSARFWFEEISFDPLRRRCSVWTWCIGGHGIHVLMWMVVLALCKVAYVVFEPVHDMVERSSSLPILRILK